MVRVLVVCQSLWILNTSVIDNDTIESIGQNPELPVCVCEELRWSLDRFDYHLANIPSIFIK